MHKKPLRSLNFCLFALRFFTQKRLPSVFETKCVWNVENKFAKYNVSYHSFKVIAMVMVSFFSLLIKTEELISELTRTGTIATVRYIFLLFLHCSICKIKRCNLVRSLLSTTPPLFVTLWTWVIYGCKKLILSPTWLALCIHAGWLCLLCLWSKPFSSTLNSLPGFLFSFVKLSLSVGFVFISQTQKTKVISMVFANMNGECTINFRSVWKQLQLNGFL